MNDERTERRGGVRIAGPGKKIGRPTTGRGRRQTLCLSLSPEVAEYLGSQINKSQAVDQIVSKTKAFREWSVTLAAEQRAKLDEQNTRIKKDRDEN